MKDHTAPPPSVDPYEEYKYKYYKPPIPTHETPPPSTTRVKYTKKIKELVQQHLRGHYTGNKYDLFQATHRCNNRAQVNQGTIVDTTEHQITVLAKNLQGKIKLL